MANTLIEGDLVIESGADVFVPAGAVITLDYIVLKSDTKNWKIKVDDLGNIFTEELN